MDVNINIDKLNLDAKQLNNYRKKADDAVDKLWDDKRVGTSWVKTPMSFSDQKIEEIIMTALAAQDSCGLFVVVGNGGTYLGAKAAIESMDTRIQTAPEVEFIGGEISSKAFGKLIEKMRHYEVNVCVMSKSGETIETLVAYEMMKQAIVTRYGEKIAPKRIMVMTGDHDSTLKRRALEDGSGVFNIPTGFIGNYGILSPASLFCMSVAGLDIKRLLRGAEVMATDPIWDIDGTDYAIARKIMRDNGKAVELISFDNAYLETFSIWVSHLFMESENKENKGLFTSSLNMPRDFKTYADFIAAEKNDFLMTEISCKKFTNDIVFSGDMAERFSSKSINSLNETLYNKIKEAKDQVNSKEVMISISEMNEFQLGQLIYYFLMTAAVSAELFDVDPFERKEVKSFKNEIAKEKL